MKKKQISIMLTSILMMNMITCSSVYATENDVKASISQMSKSQILENIKESKTTNSVSDTYVSDGTSESLRPYVKNISKSMMSIGGSYQASIGISGKAMPGSTVYIKLGDEIANQHIDESKDFGFSINTKSRNITVEIYAIDQNGNKSDSVLVTVTDEDDTISNNGISPNSSPVIKASNITLNKGDRFDPFEDVTAYDEEDGNITNDIEVVENNVDENKVGKYKVKYRVSDSEGETTTKEITVNVVSNNKKPVINAKDITITKGDKFDPLKGVTAYDEEDGNITNYIEVVKNTVDENKIGKYKVVYEVTDSEEDVTTKEITVTVINTNEKPVINAKDITITIGDNFDKMKGVTASDKEDGDITSKIKVSGEVDVNKLGTYTLSYSVKDSDGNITNKDIQVRVANKEIVVKSVSGNDRYDTAVELSKLQFDSSDTVVIVNGNSLADGLAVTPLAAYKKSPILLATNGNMPQSTKNEIKRLGATNVIIAGGLGAVNKEVENQLKNLGITNIQRLGGSNRYDTSLKIAQYIDENCYNIENIVVSNGLGEADALSISAVAGRDNMPIILTQKDTIEKDTYNWLKSKNLRNAYIIGGKGMISDSVLNQVNGITSENISGNRLGGNNRYDTNAIIINKFFKNDLDNIYVSKGMPLVDALAAGSVAALNDAPVIIVGNDLSPMQKDIIDRKNGNTIIKSGGGISEKAITSLKNGLKK